MQRFSRLVAVCVTLALGTSLTCAQVQRSGGGEAQKFMQQYQQLASEKTALQGQLAQMKKDLDAANAELAAVKKERDAAKAHVGISPAALAQANTAKQTAETNLEKSRRQTQELVGRYRELAASLRDVEAAKAKLAKDLTERNAAFDQCAEKNMQMFELTTQVLDRYEHVGAFTRASTIEPFTKISRTRIENLVDEYRERAQQLRVQKAAPPAQTPPPAQTSPATQTGAPTKTPPPQAPPPAQ